MFPGLVNYCVSAGLSEKAPTVRELGDSTALGQGLWDPEGSWTPTPVSALLLLHSGSKHGLEKQEDPGSNLGPEACRK